MKNEDNATQDWFPVERDPLCENALQEKKEGIEKQRERVWVRERERDRVCVCVDGVVPYGVVGKFNSDVVVFKSPTVGR